MQGNLPPHRGYTYTHTNSGIPMTEQRGHPGQFMGSSGPYMPSHTYMAGHPNTQAPLDHPLFSNYANPASHHATHSHQFYPSNTSTTDAEIPKYTPPHTEEHSQYSPAPESDKERSQPSSTAGQESWNIQVNRLMSELPKDDDEDGDWASSVPQEANRMSNKTHVHGQALSVNTQYNKAPEAKGTPNTATPDILKLQALSINKTDAVEATKADTVTKNAMAAPEAKPGTDKVTVQEPKKSETVSGATSQPGPKHSNQVETGPSPAAKPAVDKNSVYFPDDAPLPPPSGSRKPKSQVVEAKRKEITLPNLGIVPPSQLRQRQSDTEPKQYYGKEPVVIAPVAERQRLSEKYGLAAATEHGLSLEPLQLFIPIARWHKHCSGSSVRSNVKGLLGPQLALSYTDYKTPKHNGVLLNVNLRHSTRRDQQTGILCVRAYMDILRWKDTYPTLDMAKGIEAARADQIKSASASAPATSTTQQHAKPVVQKPPAIDTQEASKAEVEKITAEVRSKIGNKNAKEARGAVVKYFRDIRSSYYKRDELAWFISRAWRDIDWKQHAEAAQQWYDERDEWGTAYFG